jgi:hypothetical protein
MKTAVVVVVSALLAGCATSSHQTESKPATPLTVTASPPATQPALAAVVNDDEPISPQFAPPAAPTESHLQDIEPAVLELARRAEAGDRTYFLPKMGQPGDHMVELMMEKVRQSDLPNTYRTHLVGDRLNYHDKTHVQVELAQQGGKWAVSKLWFCR